MQSNAARAGVAIVAIAVVVIGFVVLGGDDSADNNETQAGAQNTTTSAKGKDKGKGSPTGPSVEIINVKGGQPVGGVADLTFQKGEEIQFVVQSDTAAEIHLHGYDVMKDVKAGGRVTFDVPATIDGIFEAELEETATQVARITVNP